MEDRNEDEQLSSKYNSALAQIYRIDSLWKDCHLFRQHGRLLNWNHKMDSIWTELASDAKLKDFKKFDLFAKLIVKYKNNRNPLNYILMKKEIWLRILQNKQGKGTAYEDGSEDDFE